jgi:hypothetical protein
MRQRKVFGSNSQVCHVWAQQTQNEGSAGNIFFEGNKIYSYGRHYLAAQIHTVKGKRVALVRSDTYSVSTSGHLSDIRSALYNLIPAFDSPNVSDLKAAISYLDQCAQKQVEGALKRVKVENKESIQSEFRWIHDQFKEANELRKLVGRKEIWPTKKQLDAVQAHLEKRLQRFKELNTPEMIEKKRIERERREIRKAERAVEKRAEDIVKFRAGEISRVDLPCEILRVKGDTVETSRGAQVPLRDAVRLFAAILSGRDVTGLTVGHFTLNEIYSDNAGDKVVRIGCHAIKLSEAQAVLGPYQMKLLQGGAA